MGVAVVVVRKNGAGVDGQVDFCCAEIFAWVISSALMFLNSPFTLVIIKCLTLNKISLCAGSKTHLVVVFSMFVVLNCLSDKFQNTKLSRVAPGCNKLD